MKKSGLNARWLYPLLCVAIVGVSLASVAVYRNRASSLAEDLVNDTLKPPAEVDISAVDKLVGNVPKDDTLTNPEVSETVKDTLEEVFAKKAVYMPVHKANIIGEFSFGELVKSPSGVWKTHDGVDLAADEGDPVKAMTSGKVTKVYADQLWGNCVEIDHGDAITGYYFGLSDDIKVQAGDEVQAGSIIGFVGETEIEGNMPPHLHFGLKQGDKWIDPVGYIEPYK